MNQLLNPTHRDISLTRAQLVEAPLYRRHYRRRIMARLTNNIDINIDIDIDNEASASPIHVRLCVQEVRVRFTEWTDSTLASIPPG